MSESISMKDSDSCNQIDAESKSALSANEQTEFEVSFSEDGDPDPENIARHLPLVRKYYISSLITLTSTVITIISSCWSLASPNIMKHFHISHEVSTLGITLYIFGLGFGPLFYHQLVNYTEDV